jgi:uncharacterized spore protein YtfJ
METEELFNRVAENLSVRRAFGTPYEKDGLLVVPVALVAGGGGGGEGPKLPPSLLRGVADRSTKPGVTHGSEEHIPASSGGGFGGLVLPMGAYVVKGDQVRWVPAVDVTLVVLAGLSVLRLLVRLRARVRLQRYDHV